MNYVTPRALRTALEQRLLQRSLQTGISLDRLRRRVVFERLVARLVSADPDCWVVKGGMALEVRLQDRARLTKDLDLGLRDDVGGAGPLHERLIEALSIDQAGDRFEFVVSVPALSGGDGAGRGIWRARVEATLAGATFGRIQLDISPRAHELTATDRLELPSSLEFAGVPSTSIEVVDIHRHAAEKLHAMTRSFGDRENSRVRDLVDLVLLMDHQMLTPGELADRATDVWREREGMSPPGKLPSLPETWPSRYRRIATDVDLDDRSYDEAVVLVERLWQLMFPEQAR